MAATAASTISSAAAVTRRNNAALRVDATNGDTAARADGQNERRSPAAKRVNDDVGGDVWVAVDEADVSGGQRRPAAAVPDVQGQGHRPSSLQDLDPGATDRHRSLL
ncbi:hypothetical protein EE612_039927, partial [Oryza sativa]